MLNGTARLKGKMKVKESCFDVVIQAATRQMILGGMHWYF
jgi:hypothetical protein